MGDRRLRVAYVCNFASPHARGLVSYFAGRCEEFHLIVFSTQRAEEMVGVTLHILAQPVVAAIKKEGLLARLAYFLVRYTPRIYEYLRLHQDVLVTPKLIDSLLQAAQTQDFDVIHGMRCVPEGHLARILAQSKNAPLVMSSWGQDFVIWAARHPVIGKWTRELMQATALLLPDNQRDADLAHTRWGYQDHKRTYVMPATGGLDPTMLERLLAKAPVISPLLSPSYLSMRGYNNLYNKTDCIVDAFSIFKKEQPKAHLYIDGPEGHPGKRVLEKKVKALGLQENVSFLHLSRSELFAYMHECDFFVSASINDGLPMSLVEALYFGQIPITAKLPSLTPPLYEGENGELFSGIDPLSIVKAMRRAQALAKVPRNERENRNRKLLNEKMSRSRNLEKLAGFYRSLVYPVTNPVTSSESGSG